MCNVNMALCWDYLTPGSGILDPLKHMLSFSQFEIWCINIYFSSYSHSNGGFNMLFRTIFFMRNMNSSCFIIEEMYYFLHSVCVCIYMY